MVKPFFLYKELRMLLETYKAYDDMAEEYYEMLDAESDVAVKVFRKRDHYNRKFEELNNAMKNRICRGSLFPQPTRTT